MPRPSRSGEIDALLLAKVEAHPVDLVRMAATELGLSRTAVAARVHN